MKFLKLGRFLLRCPRTRCFSSSLDFQTDKSRLSELTHALTPLTNTRIISVRGSDSLRFLQSITTNDVSRLKHDSLKDRCQFTCFLNHRGRYLFECLLSKKSEDEFWLEISRKDAAELTAHLSRRKARSKVVIDGSDELNSRWRVWSLMPNPQDGPALEETLRSNQSRGGNAYMDPRYPKVGGRVTVEVSQLPPGLDDRWLPVGNDCYRWIQMMYGVSPFGEGLASKEKSIFLEWNGEEQRGISFEKGCYLGQELMTRTKHTGRLRKRVYPCLMTANDGPVSGLAHSVLDHDSGLVFSERVLPFLKDSLPEWDSDSGVSVMDESAKRCGSLITRECGLGLALLKDEAWQSTHLRVSLDEQSAEHLTIVPYCLPWLRESINHLLR